MDYKSRDIYRGHVLETQVDGTVKVLRDDELRRHVATDAEAMRYVDAECRKLVCGE